MVMLERLKSMNNYQLDNGEHCFLINGGDSRTTKWAYALAVSLPLVFGILYVWGGIQSLPIPLFVWVLLIVALIAGGFVWLSKGSMSRYEVRINPTDNSIRAIDRFLPIKEDARDRELWVDDFHPERVYLAHIQVIVGNDVHRYPVLAYGEEQQELIEDGVPYVTQTLLGFGEKEEVESMLKTLQST